MRGGLVGGLVAAALVTTSCTTHVVPSPGPAIDEFIAAWSDLDAAALRGRLADESAATWTQEEIDAFLTGLVEDGALSEIRVVRSGPIARRGPDEVDDDDASQEITATVPLEITYTSSAVDDSVTLATNLTMVYDLDLHAWTADWSPATAFGDIEDAHGLRVEYEWGSRAPIVDRAGRTLARGTGEGRLYPYGSLAGSTVGHIAPPETREGGGPADDEPVRFMGASGLEAAYEERLAGEPGAALLVVDETGDVVETLDSKRPRPAKPLRATLDAEVQRAAAAAFGGTTGGAVVLDPRSGDLLAVVSSSEIDPGAYVGVEGINPFNRALSGLYPPGSSLKVMTAAAALEEDVVTADSRLTGPAEYRGVRNFESGEFGTLDFATAVRHSVNTAFAQVAEKLGAKRLTAYAEEFGFNSPPAMPLDAAISSFPEPADEGDLMWSSIGQAQVLATPLQMATVAATIANGGRRMEPRAALEDPRLGARVVSRATARTLTTLMEGVVRGGTGTGANISGVRVAGKTGTAEVDVGGERRNHAWFVAFAPADNPRVAVAVVSEYGGVGGQVAAPLARAILQATLPLVR